MPNSWCNIPNCRQKINMYAPFVWDDGKLVNIYCCKECCIDYLKYELSLTKQLLKSQQKLALLEAQQK